MRVQTRKNQNSQAAQCEPDFKNKNKTPKPFLKEALAEFFPLLRSPTSRLVLKPLRFTPRKDLEKKKKKEKQHIMEHSLACSQGWGESSTETLWFSSTLYSCSIAEQAFAKP